MWLRYPLALAAAYGLFLTLLGWQSKRVARLITCHVDHVKRDSARRQFQRDDGPQAPDASDFVDPICNALRDSVRQDARALPVVFIALLATTIILICIYFIWTAPLLLSELVVEGGLLASLYRPSARGTDADWLTIALEKTALPAVFMAVSLFFIALSFQIHAPQATTIVDVWRQGIRPWILVDAKNKPAR